MQTFDKFISNLHLRVNMDDSDISSIETVSRESDTDDESVSEQERLRGIWEDKQWAREMEKFADDYAIETGCRRRRKGRQSEFDIYRAWLENKSWDEEIVSFEDMFPYQCDICTSKRFKKIDALKIHRKIWHADAPPLPDGRRRTDEQKKEKKRKREQRHWLFADSDMLMQRRIRPRVSKFRKHYSDKALQDAQAEIGDTNADDMHDLARRKLNDAARQFAKTLTARLHDKK